MPFSFRIKTSYWLLDANLGDFIEEEEMELRVPTSRT
jgi:hypothetical protein